MIHFLKTELYCSNNKLYEEEKEEQQQQRQEEYLSWPLDLVQAFGAVMFPYAALQRGGGGGSGGSGGGGRGTIRILTVAQVDRPL